MNLQLLHHPEYFRDLFCPKLLSRLNLDFTTVIYINIKQEIDMPIANLWQKQIKERSIQLIFLFHAALVEQI